MKKALSVLMALLLLLTTTPLSVFAADATPTIIGTVDTDTVCPGSQVTLNVTMENNPGISCWLIQVEYDDSAMTLVNQSKGDAFSGSSLSFGPMKSPTTALWYDFVGDGNTLNNGTMFSFTFQVNEDAAEKEYPITLSVTDPENIVDWDLNPVSFTLESTSVQVGHTYSSICDEECDHCGAHREGAGHVFTDPDALVCTICGTVLDSSAALIYGVVDNPNVTRGDTFTLTVYMRNNPGLAGWMVTTSFDESSLELIDHTRGAAFGDIGDFSFSNIADQSPISGLWFDFLRYDDCYNNGELYTLTFRVKEDAAFATSMLNLYCADPDNMCSLDFETVHFNFVSTAVEVLNHTHIYDNACDAACNECGFTRIVPDHVYTDVCDDACNECGFTRVPPHTYSANCDYVCDACGYMRPTVTASHRYDNACDTDCNACGEVREIQHRYSNACDANCNVCGFTRVPADHVYDNACDAYCNVCMVYRVPAAHVYDNNCDAYCNVCNTYRTPSDHIYSITATVAPSCEDYGSQTLTCLECGDSYVESLPPLGHTYTTLVTAPTCTNRGYTTYTCIRCNHTYTADYKEPLGHAYGDWYIDSNPNCTENGSKHRQCARCQYNDTVSIPALGHTYTDTVVLPSCTAQGYTLHQCTVCPYNYKNNYTAKIPHAYGQWIVDTEATVLAEGSHHHICTVCDYREDQIIPRVAIDIETNENYGLANFTVVHAQTLQPIPNAQIFISTENDGENTFTTDAQGRVSVILPVGKQPVSAYASGCLTRNLQVNVKPGVNDIPRIGLSAKPTYEAELTHDRMTIEEIEEVGIDTSDPSNQHVYRYELKLEFDAEIDYESIYAYWNDDGTYLGGHYGGWGGGGGGGSTGGGGGGGGLSTGGIRIPVKDEVLTVYPVSEYFYLIVRGEVTWLKEMFDVEMLIINNSETDTLEDLTATLNLPEGLSLAAMIGAEQTASQYIGHIAEGKTESVHWYVRGDKAGNYALEARLQGMVMPFEEPIDDLFVAENELTVWAGNALHLHFEFPDTAYYAEDYTITSTLTNVSDITLYNIQHLVQVEQGMSVYYSDGSSKTKIEVSDWASSGVVREFHPGDQIIIEMSVNIFFKSEVIQHELEKLIGIVDGVENLVNAVKVVKTVFELVSICAGCVDGCASAIDEIVDGAVELTKKMKLFKELHACLVEFIDIYGETGNATLDAAISLGNSGLQATLGLLTADPKAWYDMATEEEIAQVILDMKTLGIAIEAGGEPSLASFDIFDSIRTAISAIPVVFNLKSVILTEDPNNTTSIPWSYSTYHTGPHYFGVSSVSKYLEALTTAAAGELYEEFMPGLLQLIPGLDDPLGKEDAVRYIQATEREIAKFQARTATGDVSFRVWVVRSGQTGADESFTLSSDNKTANYEDGVLTFTGNGTIEVTPNDITDGTLYIEDSEGNSYVYEMDVVEQHDCAAGEQEVVIPPSATIDGFAVKRCTVCSDILEIINLPATDYCAEHNFSDWAEHTPSDCTTRGMNVRNCSVCGAIEYAFVGGEGHISENWVITKEATCVSAGEKTGRCTVCGENVVVVIYPTGHGDLTWKEIKEATAFETGLREQWCGFCNELVTTEVIPMTKEPFGYGENDCNLIVGLPQMTTPDMLIAHYENMGLSATVTGPNGEAVEYIGSGCKVLFGDEEYTVVLTGDVSGDGIVNLMDLALMMRHLNGWDDPAWHDACDVDGDSKVNNRDYALLQRYLNGWDVSLIAPALV